jgi:ribonuclease P protein component
MSEATSNTARFPLPAARRLKLSREFNRVRQEGSTVRGGLITLGVLPVKGEISFRFGLITSRRVGRAVARNRVRRRLREIVRRHQHALTKGVWFVVIARPAAAGADSAALEKEWLRLAGRAGLIGPAPFPNPAPSPAPALNLFFQREEDYEQD